MKKTNRLLSLVLVLCMLLGMIPAVSAAADQTVTPEVVEPDYFTTTDWIWSSTSVTKNSVSYFRNDYELKAVPTALDVRVSAHNHVKFYVNGNIITGYVSPAPTALPENINYLSYSFTGEELTAMVSDNKLALAAAVQYMGNGGMNYTAAQPGLWAEVTVTYADGSKDVLVTGSDWEALADTPYKGNTPNMSNRQMNAQIDYDAQEMPDPLAWTLYGYDASAWSAAVDAPALTDSYKLRQQTIPEGVIHEEITPTAVERQIAGHQVFDVGRIATGWVKLTASAPAGTRICIRYSEDLTGTAGDMYVKHNVANEGSENYCDYYTFSGNGVETFISDFDYKSFRYFEVVGLPELITVENVTMQWASTGVEYTAEFTSDNELLNQIYQACINTQINNLEGMPVDCPHREQSQYLADSQLQYALLSYAFSDFETINYKTLLDFAAQQFDSGRFTFVAPSQMYASGNSIPEWDLRYANMLYNYYWVSGDVEGMSCFYDDAAENVNYYLGYVDATGLLPDIAGWNISDHPEKQACGDDPGAAPTVCNILLYDSLNHLSKIATLLGKDDDAAIWASKAQTLRTAINTNLLNHETGMYYKYYGSTATNEGITAMAINLGVSEPNQLEKQMEAISKQGLTSTSVVLTYEIFNAIMEHGTAAQKEAIYERIIRVWGPMIKAGDSTIWEGFRDENSHSHAWNAYPARAMLQAMLGINYEGVDYTDIVVKPWLPEELNYLAGTVNVPDDRGYVRTMLQREDDGSLEVMVDNKSDDTITVAVPRVDGNTVITELNEGTVFANGQGAAAGSLVYNDVVYLSNDAEYVYVTVAPNYAYHFTSSAAADATEGTFDVTINGTEGGTVKFNGEAVELPYTATLAAGTEVNLEAVADSSAAFLGWSGTYGSVDKVFSFTVGGNVSLTASFEAREGTVYNTIAIDGPADSGLKVSVNGVNYAVPARVSVEAGTAVTLTAVEPDNRTYNFVAWTGDVFSARTELSFTADENVDLEVIGSYRGASSGNLALGKTATFNHVLESSPLWLMSNLTDGKTYGKNPGAIGATSGSYSSGDLSANPNILTLDLATTCTFDQVCLYPRADEVSADGGVPCYPSTFTISVSTNGSTYTDVASVTDYIATRNEDGTVDPIVVNFDEQNARYIRMTTTKANGADNHGTCYVQLHEMEVYKAGEDVSGLANLTIKGSGNVQINGETVSLPYSGNYEYGTELAILPVAAQNTRFIGWTGAVTSSNLMLYLTMDNSIAVSANFANTVVSKSENLALNAAVTTPEGKFEGAAAQWSTAYLTDGIQTSTGETATDGKKGITSIAYASPELTDESLYVEIDLGKDVDFNQLTLWPRTDVFGANGEPESPNFPTAFKVQYKLDGDTVWRDIKTFTDVANPMGSSATFDLGLQNGRYIRIIPITLGSPAADDVGGAKPYRFQLVEAEVYADEVLTDNLAVSATLTTNNSGSNAGAWAIENLVDGQVRSAGRGTETGTKGFTSNGYGAEAKDISSNPHWIQVDWDAPIDVNQVILYPRSDLDGDTANSGLAANFPENFQIQAMVDGAWKTVYSATGVNNGLSPVICDFETVTTSSLRLLTTGLGVCAADENSRTLRVQLAEMKVGNIIRGEFTEGSVDITLNGEDVATVSLSQLPQLLATVEASTIGGDALVWSIEDEQGFVVDVADLIANGNTPTLRPNNEGEAYVVARFANGLNTYDKLPINIVASLPTVAMIGDAEYSSVQAALNAADADDIVVLVADSNETVNVAADKTLNLDLNGYDLGKVVVADGGKFYGLDSTTDEYNNNDSYGKIGDIEGDYAKNHRVVVDNAGKRYVAVAEEGGISFHRFYVGITHMALRPGVGGAGYTMTLAGDEKVKSVMTTTAEDQKVYGYTVYVEGNKANGITCSGTAADFQCGIQKMEALTVDGILKTTNTADVNEQNAKTVICVEAFVMLNGEKVVTEEIKMTFKDIVLATDAALNIKDLTDTQKAALLYLYNNLGVKEMNWGLVNIPELAK